MRVWGGEGRGREGSQPELCLLLHLFVTMRAWLPLAAALLLQVPAAGRDGDPGGGERGGEGCGEGLWGWGGVGAVLVLLGDPQCCCGRLGLSPGATQVLHEAVTLGTSVPPLPRSDPP